MGDLWSTIQAYSGGWILGIIVVVVIVFALEIFDKVFKYAGFALLYLAAGFVLFAWMSGIPPNHLLDRPPEEIFFKVMHFANELRIRGSLSQPRVFTQQPDPTPQQRSVPRIQITRLLCEQTDQRSEFTINPAMQTLTHTIISPTQGTCTAHYVNGDTGTVIDPQSCPSLGGIIQIYRQVVQISGSKVTWRTIPVSGFAAADETESIDLSTNTWTDNSGARFRCSRQR